MGRRAQRRRQPPAAITVLPTASPVPSLAPPDEVSLDRLADLVSARALIDAEVAHLVDALAVAGTSWPAIASEVGVSRQAARQAHTRRTRHHAGRADTAGPSPAARSSAAGSRPRTAAAGRLDP